MVTMIVIKCPETDQEIPTGIMTDLARFDRLVGYATLVCPHCSKLHRWSTRDAFLSITFEPREKRE
jgi:hypothetical protein